MTNSINWNRFEMFLPGAFNHPGKMDLSILTAFNQFCKSIGVVPVILSDFRPGDHKQHGLGRAIDAYFPDMDPLFIWNRAKGSGLFSGLGVYLNEADKVSFHFDTRVDRTPDDPALWGSFLVDGQNNYVGASLVLDQIKKNAWIALPVVAAILWVILRRA